MCMKCMKKVETRKQILWSATTLNLNASIGGAAIADATLSIISSAAARANCIPIRLLVRQFRVSLFDPAIIDDL
jgi:hypothetical protein